MNRKRTEFLARNVDVQIKDYLFGQGHCCDIQDGALITEFTYYPYQQFIKDKIIDGVMLLPYAGGEWTEDKIWLTSIDDARFFVDWYNQNYNAEAILTESD